MQFTGLCITGLYLSSCYPGVTQDLHASVVQQFLVAPGQNEEAIYADPKRGLGPPDGRTVALGLGSSLSLRFFRPIPNGAGPDLSVIELGPDGARARVAISEDGGTFFEYPLPATSGNSTLYDFDSFGLNKVTVVRIRGLDNSGEDPGFDLDALEALH
ncbi:MAG: hypothetical protein VYC39_03260 [Myxococcota bacterium]|nr:hypothetical protein [Myxococcota bacterium]